MEEERIRERVQEITSSWEFSNSRNGVKASISPKATDFLVELVKNIKDDPSPNWNLNSESESEYHQIRAFDFIYQALDKVYQKNGNNGSISTWEIWHEITHILDLFCFIPKKPK